MAFTTQKQALEYAKNRVKEHRDRLDGIEIWVMPNGTYEVNHTMNSSGRNWAIDRKGQFLSTIYQE